MSVHSSARFNFSVHGDNIFDRLCLLARIEDRIRDEVQAVRDEIQSVRVEGSADRRTLREEGRADREAIREEGRADREAIRKEARADREAFEKHIIRLTREQGRIAGVVEQIRIPAR